jgi:hypothetical protein
MADLLAQANSYLSVIRRTCSHAHGRVEPTSQAECAGSIPVIGSTPSWSDPPRSPLSWAGGPVHRASAHTFGSPGEPSPGSISSMSSWIGRQTSGSRFDKSVGNSAPNSAL